MILMAVFLKLSYSMNKPLPQWLLYTIISIEPDPENLTSLVLAAASSDLENTVNISELEVDEPQSFKEAQQSKHADKWMAAFEEEYRSQMDNKSWELVSPSQLPARCVPIRHKWIGKYKPGYGDLPPRFKGRLTAVGCAQQPGVDYDDTFAPVPRTESFLIFMSIVATENLEMVQIDIKTAFLNADLDKPIFMTQPEGFLVPGKEDWPVLLKKALYGTKQAPMLWSKTLKGKLEAAGLKPLAADGCVYIRVKGNETAILVVYVDDVIYASNKKKSLKIFVDYMASEFENRNLPPTRFLGLNMERDRSSHQIFISQRYTILSLLEKYGMVNCTPVLTPADPNAHLTASMLPTSEGEKLDMTKVPYKSAVGALLYLANATRTDVTYSVGPVVKYCANPQPAHWIAVKRILAYLKGTFNLGIWLGGTNEGVVCYGDADYAGDVDNRKSTSGIISFLRGGPVSWASRQQNTIALSTTQSEYQALAEVCKDAVWLNRVNAELNPIKNESNQEKALSAVELLSSWQRIRSSVGGLSTSMSKYTS